MQFAPRNNWSLYESLTSDHDEEWIRTLTPQQRFQIYCELFNLIHQSHDGRKDWKSLEAWQWEQKVSMRQKLVTALHRLDIFRNERDTTGRTGRIGSVS